jgi:hypothetical protein
MSIQLSAEFGLNPSVTKCFYCGEDCGVALFGTGFKKKDEHGYLKTAEAPRCVGVIDMSPCIKCEDYMHQGIIIISMRDGEGAKMEKQRLAHLASLAAMPNNEREKYGRPFIPEVYRTGLWTVIRAESPLFGPESPIPEQTRRYCLEQRWIFMEDSAVKGLGLGEAAGMELDAEGHWTTNKEREKPNE